MADNPTSDDPTLALPENDDRFTFGLSFDVSKVLLAHGYPFPDGADFVNLQLALWRLLYSETDLGRRARG